MDINRIKELAGILTEGAAFNQQDSANGFIFHDAKVITTDNTGHMSNPYPVETIIIFPIEKFAIVFEGAEIWKCFYQGSEGDAFVIAYREKLEPSKLAELLR